MPKQSRLHDVLRGWLVVWRTGRMVMRISMLKRIEEGNRLPLGYGVAWYDVPTAYVICLPLGVNKLAGLMRRGYRWLLAPPWFPNALSRLDKIRAEAYRAGRTRGQAEGRAQLMIEGRRAAEAIIMKLVRAKADA